MRISDWSSDVCSSDLQQRDNLACVDEAEAAGKNVDAAATGPRPGQLQIGDVGRLLREARPDIAEAIVTRRLALESARTRSEERRVGKECVSTCRSRCGPNT